MSSNAFARSRPRIRHQRVPRTNEKSCDHPRFLQLVNELTRINEARKKQEESEGNSGGCIIDCSVEDSSVGAIYPINSLNGGVSCCSAPQTSNGYRTLDCNESSSTLHGNYHQQNHHQRYQHPEQLLGNNSHQGERCPGKTSSNFSYSKPSLVVEQGNLSIDNNNLDLRQDENRSKRKRPANEPPAGSRKSLSCGSGTSKRHKSSPDIIRPLSPSFTKCPICLLDTMGRDPSFTNTCFHLFCYVCIENWTKNKATCPLCRTKFTKIIYNIRSATLFEEKTASPIRRDDDDGYIADRLMLEHLSSLNSNSVSNRSTNSDDVQFLFENLRNPEVLMPQYFVNQMDPRQGESLHSFNSVSASTNFNSNVPHPPFTPTSYPIASNYIALFPPNRIAPSTSSAITSAYSANTGLTNMNSDPNNRRSSRSGRYIYSRNYEPPPVDGPSRVPRAPSTGMNQLNVPIERNHQHQHHNHHQQHAQHRPTLDMSQRQNQRLEQPHTHIQLAYPIQPRHYNTNISRRPYNNPPVEHQHLLDTLYRQMPDM